MLKAITAAKKKNDQPDAEKITDLLRVNWLPECTMLPQEIKSCGGFFGITTIWCGPQSTCTTNCPDC